jgi:hypothetical protein
MAAVFSSEVFVTGRRIVSWMIGPEWGAASRSALAGRWENVDLIILLTQDTDGMLVLIFVNCDGDLTHLLSASSQHEHVHTRWMVAQRCGAPVSQGWTKIGQASVTLCRWLPWRIPMKADLTHHRCEPATPDDNARG